MAVLSPFLINSFNSLLLIKSSANNLKCFWPAYSKKLPSVKPKLQSIIDADWITFTKLSRPAKICLMISCVNTGFTIANKRMP